MGRYQLSWEGVIKVGKMSQWPGRYQHIWEGAITIGKKDVTMVGKISTLLGGAIMVDEISQWLGRYQHTVVWKVS